MNLPMQMAQSAPLLLADPAAIAAAETAKAEVQAAFIMAMQRPRNPEQARADIMRLCLKPDFAEAVEYAKPVAGTRITGLSVRFAEQALRLWRNVKTSQRVVYEDDNVRRIKVVVLDLEGNAEFSRELSIGKTVERKNPRGRDVVSERTNSNGEVVYIVRATEDELATKEAAAVAKAIRNEGLRLLPYDIKEEALETARKTLRNRDAQDPDAAMRKIVDGFARINVTVVMLEEYLRHPVAQCSPAEIEDLRKVYQSVSSGEARWQDYVRPAEDETKSEGSAADLTAAARKAAAKQPAAEAPTVKCPKDDGEPTFITICDNCQQRPGCPAWETN